MIVVVSPCARAATSRLRLVTDHARTPCAAPVSVRIAVIVRVTRNNMMIPAAATDLRSVRLAAPRVTPVYSRVRATPATTTSKRVAPMSTTESGPWLCNTLATSMNRGGPRHTSESTKATATALPSR